MEEPTKLRMSPVRSRLILRPWHANGVEGAAITIDSPAPMPGRWHRFWYKVLLGWTWEEL